MHQKIMQQFFAAAGASQNGPSKPPAPSSRLSSFSSDHVIISVRASSAKAHTFETGACSICSNGYGTADSITMLLINILLSADAFFYGFS
ncbi:hypothetical protein CEXT_444661 [Caerostris extrusa]|uniref:Uncharacterized protein n=1 Tax=Caerostris extrusa TaxID=172846 RepID=A0AAV4UJK9_CAEEX|nr:hypothetical protein CEXT_444661 [Caerostris extrusa]